VRRCEPGFHRQAQRGRQARRRRQRRRSAARRACRAPGQSRQAEPLKPMRFAVLAALAALVSQSPLPAQSGASTNPAFITPLAGSWTYSSVPGATEADFISSDSRTQLSVKCVRASRQLWVSRPSAQPVTQFSLWTSEMTRNLSATFNPSTGQATALLAAYDPLLDALALSRARIAIGVP